MTDKHILKLHAVKLEEGLLQYIHASTDLKNRRTKNISDATLRLGHSERHLEAILKVLSALHAKNQKRLQLLVYIAQHIHSRTNT
jgi:hypothetical protein